MYFSVIIPIYNVIGFIRRGIDCLERQTFRDFEVIMVDDGSTDGSSELLDEIEKTHSYVRVYHQGNAGSGPARNLGIEKARGEYLMFFDIDDIIHADALSIIERYLKRQPIDLLIFSYNEIDARTGINTQLKFEYSELYTNSELRSVYIPKLCGMRFNNGFVWNKVYNRLFLEENKLKFEPLRIQQDEAFNLTVYPKAERVIVLDQVLYDYFVYSSGNTRSRYIPERLEIYRSIRNHFHQLIDVWNLDNIDFKLFVEERFVTSFMEFLKCNFIQSSQLTQNDLINQIEEKMSARDIQEAVSFVLTNGNGKGVTQKFYKAINRRSATKYLKIYHSTQLVSSIKEYIKRFIR